MSLATASALCRITVFGPEGRADLAVPTVTTVGELIPVLLRHVVDESLLRESLENGSWVLQRLDEPPMDPDGTPETLDWLDGERLYLRPAEDPLPELDFDDIADGMATVISRRSDRWNETVNRAMFLGLAVVTLAAAALVLAQNPGALWASVATGLSVLLLGATILVARTKGDAALAAITGLAGCGYAGLAGAMFVLGEVSPLQHTPTAVLSGGLAMTGCAALLLGLHRTLTPKLPIVPYGIAVAVGVAALLSVWLDIGVEVTGAENAGIMAVTAIVLLVLAPKIATRSARLRGPQLPRTSDELQIDIEPQPAAQIVDRVSMANSYLTVLAAGAAAVVAFAAWYLLAEPNRFTQLIAALAGTLILLRAREFQGMPQRLFLVAGGTVDAVLLVWTVAGPVTLPWRFAFLGVLLFCVHMLVLAALRPATRRLLPLWGHLANIVETCAAIAIVPLLLHLLGVFAWARGLSG